MAQDRKQDPGMGEFTELLKTLRAFGVLDRAVSLKLGAIEVQFGRIIMPEPETDNALTQDDGKQQAEWADTQYAAAMGWTGPNQ